MNLTEHAEKELYLLFEDHNSNTNNTIEPDQVYEFVENIKGIVKKDTYLAKIKVFMDTFDQKVNRTPEFPVKDNIMLRLSLMLEELWELAEACGSEVLNDFGIMLYKKSEVTRKFVEDKRELLTPNMTKVLDALVDHEYVSAGTVLAFGLHEVFSDAFQEVHDSNMSKKCIDAAEAIQTQEKYQNEGIETTAVEKDKGFLILRQSDRKVLKSINYKEAQLDKFLV